MSTSPWLSCKTLYPCTQPFSVWSAQSATATPSSYASARFSSALPGRAPGSQAASLALFPPASPRHPASGQTRTRRRCSPQYLHAVSELVLVGGILAGAALLPTKAVGAYPYTSTPEHANCAHGRGTTYSTLCYATLPVNYSLPDYVTVTDVTLDMSNGTSNLFYNQTNYITYRRLMNEEDWRAVLTCAYGRILNDYYCQNGNRVACVLGPAGRHIQELYATSIDWRPLLQLAGVTWNNGFRGGIRVPWLGNLGDYGRTNGVMWGMVSGYCQTHWPQAMAEKRSFTWAGFTAADGHRHPDAIEYAGVPYDYNNNFFVYVHLPFFLRDDKGNDRLTTLWQVPTSFVLYRPTSTNTSNFSKISDLVRKTPISLVNYSYRCTMAGVVSTCYEMRTPALNHTLTQSPVAQYQQPVGNLKIPNPPGEINATILGNNPALPACNATNAVLSTNNLHSRWSHSFCPGSGYIRRPFIWQASPGTKMHYDVSDPTYAAVNVANERGSKIYGGSTATGNVTDCGIPRTPGQPPVLVGGAGSSLDKTGCQ